MELANLNGIFVVDLDNDKYYLVDGVSRTDSTGWYDDYAYEYLDIQAMYDMLTNYGNVYSANNT